MSNAIPSTSQTQSNTLSVLYDLQTCTPTPILPNIAREDKISLKPRFFIYISYDPRSESFLEPTLYEEITKDEKILAKRSGYLPKMLNLCEKIESVKEEIFSNSITYDRLNTHISNEIYHFLFDLKGHLITASSCDLKQIVLTPRSFFFCVFDKDSGQLMHASSYHEKASLSGNSACFEKELQEDEIKEEIDLPTLCSMIKD